MTKCRAGFATGNTLYEAAYSTNVFVQGLLSCETDELIAGKRSKILMLTGSF